MANNMVRVTLSNLLPLPYTESCISEQQVSTTPAAVKDFKTTDKFISLAF